jgi:hypothetical protein
MVNAELLNNTVREIHEGLFNWEQGDWVGGNSVPDGLSANRFDNACNTSYCFAGRVASRERSFLFRRDFNGEFRPYSYFVALENEPGSVPNGGGIYTTETVNGKVRFREYTGPVIYADDAAINDLGINHHAAGVLFSGSNTIDAIEEVVENIIEKGDDYRGF